MSFKSARNISFLGGLLLGAGQASQNIPAFFQEKRNGRCQQKAEETYFATDQIFLHKKTDETQKYVYSKYSNGTFFIIFSLVHS